MREIDELLALCRYGGSRVALSQGAGGNVSVKRAVEQVMWIKASGYRLSAVNESDGYLRMRMPSATTLEEMVDGLDRDAANSAVSSLMQSMILDSTNLRPSMETWFHIVLGRVVLHTHPIYANAFSCMRGGERILANLLPAAPAFVEYRAPGPLLGRSVQRVSGSYTTEFGKPPAHILLANHGLITVGETVPEAIAATQRVLEAGQSYFGAIDDRDLTVVDTARALNHWATELQAVYNRHGEPGVVTRASRFGALVSIGEALPNPLVPDDVVCNGESVLRAGEGESASEFVGRHFDALTFSGAIALPGQGFVFLARSNGMLDAMEEQLLANVVVRRLIQKRGECVPLAKSEIIPLLSMEQEKHRRSVLARQEEELLCRS